MATNRITRYQPRWSPAAMSQTPPEPQKPAPAIPPGFAVCPPQLATANPWQQEIYRLAYERAQAATRVPRHHRLVAYWN